MGKEGCNHSAAVARLPGYDDGSERLGSSKSKLLEERRWWNREESLLHDRS